MGALPPASNTSQAAIAARVNSEGAAAFSASKFDTAWSKFREAFARVPEAPYIFNVCLSLYRDGKFGDALAACNAIANYNPTPDVDRRARALRAAIVDEAKRQRIPLRP